LFSIGVGSVSDFEMDFINRGQKSRDYNIHNDRQAFLLDKLEYTDQNYALSNERLFKNFENKWLGTKNDDSTIT